ncbi:MAG: multidrug effflux MFS transporter [Betaproteobacteria bacterium]|nr:multidrug effflux MFS transporter [Betaproteobacteria bacterium]
MDTRTRTRTLTISKPVHRLTLTLLLAGLATLGPFSIDTYLPSFPSIETSLHASAWQLQQTLSVYLLGFAIMMLFHGSLSDAYGRRPVILISLIAFALTSLGAIWVNDIQTLILLRGIQGLSAGAGMIVGRAIVRDVYQGADAQLLMSRITMMFALSPAIAPIIGGWLHDLFGWHSVFLFMTALAILLFILCYRYLPETHARHRRNHFSLRPLTRNYHEVASHPHFLLLAATVACHFAGFFLYIASAPHFVIDTLHLRSNQFAYLFMPAISGVMLGAFLSGRLAGRISADGTVRIAYFLLFTAVSVNLLYNSLFVPIWPWAVLPLTLYSTGMSLAMPSITLLALDLFPQHRGLVSSMQGFVQTLLNAIVAGVISPLLSGTPLYLSLGMGTFLLSGYAFWHRYVRLMRKCAKQQTC